MNEKIKKIAEAALAAYIKDRVARFPSLAALDVEDLLIGASYQAKKDSLLEYDEDEPGEEKERRIHGALAEMERRFLAHYIEVCYIEAGAIKKGTDYHLQVQAFGDWAAGTCIDDYQDEQDLKQEIVFLIYKDKEAASNAGRPALKPGDKVFYIKQREQIGCVSAYVVEATFDEYYSQTECIVWDRGQQEYVKNEDLFFSRMEATQELFSQSERLFKDVKAELEAIKEQDKETAR